jgi:hypothetical protein
MHLSLSTLTPTVQRAAMAAAATFMVLLAGCGGAFGTDTARDLATKRPFDKVAPPPSNDAGSTAPGLAWSDPRTWGGSMPPAGAEVVIPAGKVVVLDASPPPLAGLRIEGTLRFARTNVQLSAGYIDLTGQLEIGSPSDPFVHKAVITLTGAPVASNDGVARGLNVRPGATLSLVGSAPQPAWTKLNEHARAGATQLTLKDSTDWKAGDVIAVAPSDWYGVDPTERIALASATGTQLRLATPLSRGRWGKLQYVTNSGMSLTRDSSFTPPAAPAPTELDERAVVGNLTRNIVIQGADDEAWSRGGFGAHLMVMGLTSKVTIDGVEFRRVGQAGVLARYPVHWHLLSYGGDGSLLGDATGHVLRNSSIWQSSQRCVVIHATNGVQVLNNICQDIRGHAFFLEDAVERRNVFDGNLALTMRELPAAQRLQVHEGDVYQGGPSGFWLTNLDNVVRNNHAADAAGNGFWMAIPNKPLGLSTAVAMRPDRVPHGIFEYNTAQSNRKPGVMLAWAPQDAAGTLGVNQYIPTQDGSDGGKRLRFTLKRINSYKNIEGAYRNVASNPDYLEWTAADNGGTFFAGKVDDGVIARALVVGTSLNNASGNAPVSNEGPLVAFATYHSMASMRDNMIVAFPHVAGENSGAFSTNDYYVTAVDRGLTRNQDNRLLQTHPGFRVLSPNLGGTKAFMREATLSSALWDAHGYWGPKGQYWVYDLLFLTSGANCEAVAPAGSNGKSCDGEYYSVDHLQTDFDTDRWSFKAPISVTRLGAGGAAIGQWNVGTEGRPDGFRHFAARGGASYELKFPNHPPAKWIMLDVRNAWRDADSFLLGIEFDGSVNAAGYTAASNLRGRSISELQPGMPLAPYARVFTQAASLAEVAASTGDKIWQDRAHNMLWLKYRGGLAYPAGTGSESELYKANSIVLRGQ